MLIIRGAWSAAGLAALTLGLWLLAASVPRGDLVYAVAAPCVVTVGVLLVLGLQRSWRSLRRARQVAASATGALVDAHVDDSLLRDLRAARLALGRLSEAEALDRTVTLCLTPEELAVWSGNPPRRVAQFPATEIAALTTDQTDLGGRRYSALKMRLCHGDEFLDVRFVLSAVGTSGFRKLDQQEVAGFASAHRETRPIS